MPTGLLGKGLLGDMLLGGGVGTAPPPPDPSLGLTMPYMSIQCAFGDAPFDTARSWTEINNWCQAFSTRRGRQHELQRFEAGTLDLVLNNQDGRFSPWNTSSPYYPNLIPSTPIRIVVTWNHVQYPVFSGFVDSWIPQYGQVRAEQVVKCSDGMHLLALASLDQSTYAARILSDNPSAYYQLSDPIGSLSAEDSTTFGRDGSVSGGVTFGTAGPLLSGVSTAATFAAGQTINMPTSVGGTTVSIEGWFNASTPDTAPTFFRSTGPIVYFGVTKTGSGYPLGLANFVWQPGHTGVVGTTNICDGNWHYVVCIASGYEIQVWVDGVREGHVNAGGYLSLDPWYMGAGVGSLSQVAVYDYALGPDLISIHYQLGKFAWLTPQHSGDRIGDVLAAVGWPGSRTDLDTGISEVQAASASLAQTASLSYIQTLETTEQGMFFTDESGNLIFYDRHYIITAPAANTSNGIFANDTNSAHYHYLAALIPASDDLDLWTDVLGSRQNGVLQQSTNQAAAALYGYRTLTGFTGLLSTSDGEVLSLTQWLLAHYDYPLPRVRQLVLDSLSGKGANFPQMLGRKLLDRITLEWTPLDGADAMFDQDSLIESVQHDVTPEYWKTTWGLSPAETQPYMIVGDSTFGKIGTDNRLGF